MDPTAAVTQARRFVEAAPIAPARVSRDAAPTAGAEAAAASFDAARDQARVVGADVISFVRGVTPERREAIVNASMLAQLVAKQRVSDPGDVDAWYDAYFEVLTNIGWVVQDRTFAEYHADGQNFDAHQAVLDVASTVLGAAPAALALVTSAVNALHSMDDGSPWITVFRRESQTAHTARFQVSLAEQGEDDGLAVTLMAFALEARSTITQVLFFRARKDQATLRHASGRVTINTAVLDGVRDAIREKLVGHANDFVRALPALA